MTQQTFAAIAIVFFTILAVIGLIAVSIVLFYVLLMFVVKFYSDFYRNE